MSRLGFHLLHLFWMLVSPSYRQLSRARKIADILAEQGTRVILTGGQRLTGVHPAALCEGHPCSIHHPSNHHMTEWPQNWRDDRNLMERVCQHGIGHPDPDHLAFIRRAAGPDKAAGEAIHGCDGCCHPARTQSTRPNTPEPSPIHNRTQPVDITFHDSSDADWTDIGGGLPWHDYGSTGAPGIHYADYSSGSSDYSSDCGSSPTTPGGSDSNSSSSSSDSSSPSSCE